MGTTVKFPLNHRSDLVRMFRTFPAIRKPYAPAISPQTNKSMQKIAPFLWFDNNAEEAMSFYCSIFPDSEILNLMGPKGQIMGGTFRLLGYEFMVLNGGPKFKFNESISLFVNCDNQAEVDKYWKALTADGGKESQCGWLKDKYGLSWQIIPTALGRLLGDKDRERAGRTMQAMMKMGKIEIAELEKAADGK